MTHETPAPAAYTDVAGLAERLGIDPATVRQHIKAGTPWLPTPTKLAGRWVWLTSQLDGIEDARRAPGRPEGAKDKSPRTRRPDPPAPSSA